MSAVRLGFIGFGIMGERLLRAALNHDPAQIQVAGIYDANPAAHARLTQVDPQLRTYASSYELITNCDCLHIASPPLTHLDYLTQCTHADRAVLCEKPLATDVAQARDIVTALAKSKPRAAVNFPFASSFAVDHLRRWLADDVIGAPQRIDIELAFATWPRSWQMDAVGWLDGRAEGGFTREVASHFLFLSQRMAGELQLEQATCTYAAPDQSERAITAALTAGTLPVTLAGGIGRTEKDDHNTWMLTGPKGRIRLRDWSIAEREVNGAWQAPEDAVPNVKARPMILARQLDKVAAMTRGETTNLATLEEALAVQTIVERILAS